MLMVSMLLFSLLGILGVTWLCVSSTQVDAGAQQLPQNVEEILHDGDLFLNTTVDEIIGVLDKTVNVVNDELTNVETEFDAFVGKMLDDVKYDEMNEKLDIMLDLFDIYGNIQTHLTQVKVDVTNISTSLDDINTQCSALPQNPCGDIGSIDLSDISSLPDLPDLPSDLESTLVDVSNTFHDIPNQIDKLNLTGILLELKNQVNGISDDFKEAIKPLDDIQDQIFRNQTKLFDILDDVGKYSKSVNYGFLAVGLFIALVILVIMVGTISGSCSKGMIF